MHSLPLTRRQALTGALILAGVLVVAGRFLVQTGASAGPEPVKPTKLTPISPAPAPRLLVHVVGAVRRPGLYRLRDGSRVADAVKRAGGPTRKANVSLVNLAAPVADGTQVVIPARSAAGEAVPASPSGAAAASPVHLNTATLEELETLPGVGPATAQKIIDHREQHGPFTSVDDLDAVSGIGPARLEQLRPLVAP